MTGPMAGDDLRRCMIVAGRQWCDRIEAGGEGAAKLFFFLGGEGGEENTER